MGRLHLKDEEVSVEDVPFEVGAVVTFTPHYLRPLEGEIVTRSARGSPKVNKSEVVLTAAIDRKRSTYLYNCPDNLRRNLFATLTTVLSYPPFHFSACIYVTGSLQRRIF
ncbi:hypothetical protein CBL_08663 [Carabus blaptoides fortunei]